MNRTIINGEEILYSDGAVQGFEFLEHKPCERFKWRIESKGFSGWKSVAYAETLVEAEAWANKQSGDMRIVYHSIPTEAVYE